ncbi:hypothetical protein JZ751_013325 [Albula glossodonta]|uniref:Uncharacterized protein n=1 Tax=Albula glossodonta TaxID=121402 RepID=A0A8T2P5J7_9TELE|nr:hypothetical protein JZ751_013325 [Albula glossodonta]
MQPSNVESETFPAPAKAVGWVRSASTSVSIIPLVSSGRLRIMVKPFHMYIISCTIDSHQGRLALRMANFSVGGDFPAIFCLKVGTCLRGIPVSLPEKLHFVVPEGPCLPRGQHAEVKRRNTSHTVQVKRRNTSHTVQVKQRNTSHTVQVKQRNTSHTVQVKQRNTSHTVQVKRRNTSHTVQVKQRKTSHTVQVKRRKTSHTVQVKRRNTSHTVQVKRRNTSHTVQVKRRNTSHTVQVKQRNTSHTVQVKQRNTSHTVQVKQRNTSHTVQPPAQPLPYLGPAALLAEQVGVEVGHLPNTLVSKTPHQLPVAHVVELLPGLLSPAAIFKQRHRLDGRAPNHHGGNFILMDR